jgi:hypothetical protein
MLKRITMAAMVLLLLGAVTPPVWSYQCTPFMEVEPNDGQNLEDINGLGMELVAGTCVAISGVTEVGYGDPENPDPNYDGDFFGFGVSGITQFTLEFPQTPVVFWDARDFFTGLPLEALCEGLVCTVQAPLSNTVVVGLVAQEPAEYTVNLTAGPDTGGQSPLSQGRQRRVLRSGLDQKTQDIYGK